MHRPRFTHARHRVIGIVKCEICIRRCCLMLDWMLMSHVKVNRLRQDLKWAKDQLQLLTSRLSTNVSCTLWLVGLYCSTNRKVSRLNILLYSLDTRLTPLSRTAWVSEAIGSGGITRIIMQIICTSLQTDPCQHLITHSFTGLMLFLTPNKQCHCVRALKASLNILQKQPQTCNNSDEFFFRHNRTFI